MLTRTETEITATTSPGPEEFILCPHCGQPRKLLDLSFYFRLIPGSSEHLRDIYELCDCPGAREEQKRYERERQEKIAAESRAREEQARALRRKMKAAELKGQSGLGRRLLDCHFAGSRVTGNNARVLKVTREYAENFSRYHRGTDGYERNCLYIAGPTGTGKTHVAACVANALLEQGRSVYFATASDLLIRLREEARGDAQELGLRRRVESVDLLILDDCGKETFTEWRLSTLFGIVNARYENRLPILLTSNYSPRELQHRLVPPNGDSLTAEALMDRLLQCCRVADLLGESLRKCG